MQLLGLAGLLARPVPELAGVPMVANRTVAATRLPLALPLARVSLGLAMAAAVLTPEPPVQLAVVALAEVAEVAEEEGEEEEE